VHAIPSPTRDGAFLACQANQAGEITATTTASIISLGHIVMGQSSEAHDIARPRAAARQDSNSRPSGPQAQPTLGSARVGPAHAAQFPGNVKRFPVIVQIWLLSLSACAAVVLLSFARIDVPMALYFWRIGPVLSPLNQAFGTAVILSIESAVVLALLLTRLMRGHLSLFAEVLAIACLTSICAYAINSQVLKLFFGVPSPTEVMEGVRHTFNFLKGSGDSSFPSGHMVLAGAFAGVFMRFYRTSIWSLSALLVLAAGLLIIGDWHFLSDVVAGTFLGVSAGILAGEGWAVHSDLQS
jgi:membrane-associated phospholipid phosphatase